MDVSRPNDSRLGEEIAWEKGEDCLRNWRHHRPSFMSERGACDELLAIWISLKETRLAPGFFQKDHHQDPHEAENILVLVAVVKFFNMERLRYQKGWEIF